MLMGCHMKEEYDKRKKTKNVNVVDVCSIQE
jgi:hypothetical protein